MPAEPAPPPAQTVAEAPAVEPPPSQTPKPEVGKRLPLDLYEDALGNASDYVRAVLADDFDEAAAEALTANLNFSGRTVNPEAMPEEAAPDAMPDAGEQA